MSVGAKSLRPDALSPRIPSTPQWLSGRLTEFMFGAPSTMAIYVAGLCIAGVFMWHRSSDQAIVEASVVALVLACYRAAVLVAFIRSRSSRRPDNDALYVWMYCAGAWLYSLDLAALMVRAIVVGELLPIVMSIVMVAGYLVGLIIRAAVVRFAIPSMLLLFGPMIVGGAAADNGDYLIIAILLLFLCLGSVRYAFEARRTIIAQLTTEHRLSELVGRDPLTDLANRAGLDAYIDGKRMAVDQRRRPFSVAVIDLDGFKSVNDRYGHGVGDELLKQVAERLRSSLGGRHFLVRLGGDEFVVVFDPDTADAQAAEICNAVVDALRTEFFVSGYSVRVSGSVGLAHSAEGAGSFADALEHADAALYAAKAQGRDQLHVGIRNPGCRSADLRPRSEIVRCSVGPEIRPAAFRSLPVSPMR